MARFLRDIAHTHSPSYGILRDIAHTHSPSYGILRDIAHTHSPSYGILRDLTHILQVMESTEGCARIAILQIEYERGPSVQDFILHIFGRFCPHLP
jgi:hypothetical protein